MLKDNGVECGRDSVIVSSLPFTFEQFSCHYGRFCQISAFSTSLGTECRCNTVDNHILS
jgi:hypothetical protein